MKNQRKKLSIGLASLVLILVCAVGGTLAWMQAVSDSVTNTFAPAAVSTEVEETLGSTKKNVTVQNTGDVDAYIRAAIVVNLVNDAGNVSVAGPNDYTITWDEQNPAATCGANWNKGTDGFYYYTGRVAPGDATPDHLFDECAASEAIAEGWHLQVTILAEGIQADGMSGEQLAVETVWPVQVSQDGVMTPKT